MQTVITGSTAKGISPSNRGRSGIESFGRHKEQAKNNTGQKIYRTGFLKQKLPVIPAKPDEYEVFLKDYLTEENFNYLSECAVHYAGLPGKTIEMPTGMLQDKFCLLYHSFTAILPRKQRLNIETYNGRLVWVIYQYHKWESHTFYWMPVRFITMLSGKIREIAMSFMNLFIRKNSLIRFKHGYEFDCFFDCVSENMNYSDYYDAEREVISKLLESYATGEISVFLDEVYDYKPVNVIKALKGYKPANQMEEKLSDCFKKGLPFISGKNRIMNYNYSPYSESMFDYSNDYPPITLDRMIRYVYDLNDFVSGELEIMLEQEAQEAYAAEPVSFHILNPDSELFITDDYPERFSEWFFEMVDITKEIMNHE